MCVRRPSTFGPDSPFSWQASPQFLVSLLALAAAYAALLIRAHWVVQRRGGDPAPSGSSGYAADRERDLEAAAPRSLADSAYKSASIESGPRDPKSKLGSGIWPGTGVHYGCEAQVALGSALWMSAILLGTAISAVETGVGNKVYPDAQTDYGLSMVIYFPLGYACFMGFILPHHACFFFLLPLVNLVSGCRSLEAAAAFFPYGLVR